MGIISSVLSPWHGHLPSLWSIFFSSSLLLTSSPSLCSGKQLEEDSGTWAGSSLRRTFSFLLGMTSRDKVGVSLGSSRRAAALLILLVHPSPILLLETREGLSL